MQKICRVELTHQPHQQVWRKMVELIINLREIHPECCLITVGSALAASFPHDSP